MKANLSILIFNMEMDESSHLGFIVRWVNAIAAKVERVYVITMRAGTLQVADNVEVYSLNKPIGGRRFASFILFYRYLLKILRTANVDVCFSHMTTTFTVMAAPLLWLHRVPVITWYAHRKISLRLRLAYWLSAKIVSAAYSYKREKLVLLGHGIDTAVFTPGPTKAQQPKLILSVGRISPIKNLDTLILAVVELAKRGLDVHCQLVGPVPARDQAYLAEITDLITQLGLQERITISGPRSYAEIVDVYRSAFVHVNCAPTDNSVDKVVLEAMAVGKPSLSSAVVFQSAMGKYTQQLFFHAHDPQDLAGKLEALLARPPREIASMGAYLRQQVIRLHSLDQLTTRLVALFEEVSGARK